LSFALRLGDALLKVLLVFCGLLAELGVLVLNKTLLNRREQVLVSLLRGLFIWAHATRVNPRTHPVCAAFTAARGVRTVDAVLLGGLGVPDLV